MNHCGASVNLIVLKEGKVLFLRRISKKWANGKLQLPGGHVEINESPSHSIIRESEEELGILISEENIKPLGTIFVKDKDSEYYAAQFLLLHPQDYEYKIIEIDKCSELVWVDINNMPDDVIDIFKIVIDKIVTQNKPIVEIGYKI